MSHFDEAVPIQIDTCFVGQRCSSKPPVFGAEVVETAPEELTSDASADLSDRTGGLDQKAPAYEGENRLEDRV